MWERFQNASEAEIPSDDQELLDILTAGLQLAKDEWAGDIVLATNRLVLSDDVPAIDLVIRHKKTGHAAEARVFLCNRKTQGGGLKRQLDKVLSSMAGKACFMLRASDFPPNGKNQTAQAMRKFRESGGRQIIVPIPEWERIMTVREFHAHYRQDPGFTTWFEDARLLSNIMVVIQLLRLDLLGRSIPRTPKSDEAKSVASVAAPTTDIASPQQSVMEATPATPGGWTAGWADGEPETLPANDDELPLSVILDENGSAGSILAGRESGGRAKPITLNKDVLKRHAAVLGGSGSGKTTRTAA
jgi:hypothetical protein